MPGRRNTTEPEKLVPVRLLKNDFFRQVEQAENQGVSGEDLKTLFGRGRSKKGMFEGDMKAGELEIGQVSALVKSIIPAADIVKELWMDFSNAVADPLFLADLFLTLHLKN